MKDVVGIFSQTDILLGYVSIEEWRQLTNNSWQLPWNAKNQSYSSNLDCKYGWHVSEIVFTEFKKKQVLEELNKEVIHD